MKLELDIKKTLGRFKMAVTLAVESGVLSLFGPSGSGKSLTLRMLAGVLHPDSGRIALDGKVFFDSREGTLLPPQRRGIGYVPQSYALFPHLTVEQNATFGVRPGESEPRQLDLPRTLDLLRLTGLSGQKPAQLSGGQQQRVALARALMARPTVLLLDEPFTALEDELREALRTDLLAIQQELGVGILIVTHNLADIGALGGDLAIYDAGSVLQSGQQAKLLRMPSSERVARLLGMRNLFHASVLDRRADGSVLGLAGHRVAGPPMEISGDRLLVALPAESLRLLAPGEEVARGETVLPVQLVRHQLRAGHVLVEARATGGSFEVAVPVWWWEREHAAEGRLAIPATAIHVLRE